VRKKLSESVLNKSFLSTYPDRWLPGSQRSARTGDRIEQQMPDRETKVECMKEAEYELIGEVKNDNL
jgi:hypothetical protein